MRAMAFAGDESGGNVTGKSGSAKKNGPEEPPT
jgi:hypothetical protein